MDLLFSMDAMDVLLKSGEKLSTYDADPGFCLKLTSRFLGLDLAKVYSCFFAFEDLFIN
jgi:hypothetical protein